MEKQLIMCLYSDTLTKWVLVGCASTDSLTLKQEGQCAVSINQENAEVALSIQMSNQRGPGLFPRVVTMF